jgi:hypothetical protein
MKTSKGGAGRTRTSPGLFIASGAVVLYLLLVWLTVRPVAGWYAVGEAGEKGLADAVRYDPANPVYSYLLGRYYAQNIEDPDPAKAIFYYRRALGMSPLQPGAWAGLSRSLLHTGEKSDAEYALERAVLLNPTDPNLMWEASTFWLMNGDVGRAVGALGKFILIDPEGQRSAYDLCWKLRLDNSYIMRYLVPRQYSYERRYLEYLISTKRPAAAEEVWNVIDRNSVDREIFVRYINFLIASGLYDRAEKDWKEIAVRAAGLKNGDPLPLLWNPGFDWEMLDGGFGWTVSEAGGADVFIDDSVHMTGGRSLGVTFSGEENPDATIARQVVRVVPGMKYTLRGYIKTQSLTTTNGIFLEVTGHLCKGLDRRSGTVTGTNFWQEVAVDFDVPQDCPAAVVKIRRERSNKFDNKIAGTAWIDGLSLKERTVMTASGRP